MGAGMGRWDDQLRRLSDGRVDYDDPTPWTWAQVYGLAMHPGSEDTREFVQRYGGRGKLAILASDMYLDMPWLPCRLWTCSRCPQFDRSGWTARKGRCKHTRDRSSMQRYRDLVERDGLLPNPSPEDHP